jgi:hypothetical protein
VIKQSYDGLNGDIGYVVAVAVPTYLFGNKLPAYHGSYIRQGTWLIE